VCGGDEVEDARSTLSPVGRSDRTHNPDSEGSLEILVERGLDVPRPEVGSGIRLVEPRARAQAVVFDRMFNLYHAQPWARKNEQNLRVVSSRKGLEKVLPSAAVLEFLNALTSSDAATARSELINQVAERFAINAISVYDWLLEISTESFDVSPLVELAGLGFPELSEAVHPFAGTLKKQYRMHPTLSAVPRELFYFGEALLDGDSATGGRPRARCVQVEAQHHRAESNESEAQEICSILESLNSRLRGPRPKIMLITPYREQEALLGEKIEELRCRGSLKQLDIETFTLDRCQGREAEYVFISLVRSRASSFMDIPKRWNVALTRAREGLFIVGDIDDYLRQASDARRRLRSTGGRGAGVKMSLLARIIEAYDQQIQRAQRDRP
jgi:hypothetical protein